MWIHFFLENAHFALNIFGALVMFAVSWLYFDAYLVRKGFKEGIRSLGYILLTVSFIAQATVVESGLITASIIPQYFHFWIFICTRIPGFILIIWSLILDPVQPKPKTEGIMDPKAIPNAVAIASSSAGGVQPIGLSSIPFLLSPLFSIVIGSMYLQRATIGLERHLKRVSVSFLLLGISELFALRKLFVHSTNVDIYELVAPFGPIWIVQNCVLFISLVILCRWVFGYLLKRFETQLFMIFTIMILSVFLITTVSFTGLLVKNLVDQTVEELVTNAKVLTFTLESKQQEILSDTELFAQNPQVIDAITSNDRRRVADSVTPHLLSHKLSSLIVVDANGMVLATGEDPDRYGYAVGSEPLVKQALSGQKMVSMAAQEGTITSNIGIVSGTPIMKDEQIIGAVISGSIVDTALLDGIKRATGLDASIYSGTVLSATTLLSPDGTSRPIGTQEQRPHVLIPVLNEGKFYTGGINLLNRPYFASYLPIVDITRTPVGMIVVGKPQSTVLSTAGRSIELTFLVTAVLLVLSIFPAYLISRFIVKQIR